MNLSVSTLPSALVLALFIAAPTWAAEPAADSPLAGPFRWRSSPPLFSAPVREGEKCYSIKDPTVVFHEGRWHLFCTVRGNPRSHRIEYLSFQDWDHTAGVRREMLELSNSYFCAPQVFWFSPHKKWYLVHQVIDASRKPALQPAFSTNAEIDDPAGWTKPQLLYAEQPENVTGWIDFWIIADDRFVHLFFTSNNGRMWRAQTPLSEFPAGWSRPEVVLETDVFEASHTYKLRGEPTRYVTVIEAQGSGRRYYKAYTAERLDGRWTPAADTVLAPFAGKTNVAFEGDAWADSVGHGELLRTGFDERMEVDPAGLRFLFQGAKDGEMRGKPYGEIPWRLGLLAPAE